MQEQKNLLTNFSQTSTDLMLPMYYVKTEKMNNIINQWTWGLTVSSWGIIIPAWSGKQSVKAILKKPEKTTPALINIKKYSIDESIELIIEKAREYWYHKFVFELQNTSWLNVHKLSTIREYICEEFAFNSPDVDYALEVQNMISLLIEKMHLRDKVSNITEQVSCWSKDALNWEKWSIAGKNEFHELIQWEFEWNYVEAMNLLKKPTNII